MVEFQAIWKKCSSKWESSPNRAFWLGVKIKNIWNHHLAFQLHILYIAPMFFSFPLQLGSSLCWVAPAKDVFELLDLEDFQHHVTPHQNSHSQLITTRNDVFVFFWGGIIYPNPKPICLGFWGSQNHSECKFGWRWRRVQTIPDSSYDPPIIVSNKGLKNAPLCRVRFGESLGLETQNPICLLFNSQKRDPILARNRFCQFLPPNWISKTWHSSRVDM